MPKMNKIYLLVEIIIENLKSKNFRILLEIYPIGVYNIKT